jgi:hypothetical protein
MDARVKPAHDETKRGPLLQQSGTGSSEARQIAANVAKLPEFGATSENTSPSPKKRHQKDAMNRGAMQCA